MAMRIGIAPKNWRACPRARSAVLTKISLTERFVRRSWKALASRSCRKTGGGGAAWKRKMGILMYSRV